MSKTSAVLLAGISAAVIVAASAHADVVISKKATANMSCSAGVCSPTAKDAVLNATDLATMLAAGDVTVNTGGGATDIVVKDGFSWTSTSRLTLDATQSVEFDKPVSVAGSGAVTISINDGGSEGDLLFQKKGNLTFWDLSSSLIINGSSYTLVKDIATLASDIAASPSGVYALANDYDASADGTYTSAPITTELTGTFEGLGHTVSSLTITSSDRDIGLFGVVGGTLRDIGLLKVAVEGNGASANIGSLLGLSDKATLIGCYATGAAVADVSAVVGGLVGETRFSLDGTITHSHASVNVSAPDNSIVGGLVGVSGFSISLSYATGRVKGGANSFAGGLLGSGANVTQSYAIGDVTGGDSADVGGLVGAGGQLIDSFAAGAVRGGDGSVVGGFVGEALGKIETSYSTGNVKGKNAGGFLGGISGEITFSFDYWDTDTSGKSNRQGCGEGKCGRTINGLTTEEFQSGLPVGFDPIVWGEKKTINGGLPYLLALPPK